MFRRVLSYKDWYVKSKVISLVNKFTEADRFEVQGKLNHTTIIKTKKPVDVSRIHTDGIVEVSKVKHRDGATCISVSEYNAIVYTDDSGKQIIYYNSISDMRLYKLLSVIRKFIDCK